MSGETEYKLSVLMDARRDPGAQDRSTYNSYKTIIAKAIKERESVQQSHRLKEAVSPAMKSGVDRRFY
jgi:hypothetical protein